MSNKNVTLSNLFVGERFQFIVNGHSDPLMCWYRFGGYERNKQTVRWRSEQTNLFEDTDLKFGYFWFYDQNGNKQTVMEDKKVIRWSGFNMRSWEK